MEAIIYQKEDAIARITLNRPKVLNALNEPMLDGLKASLEDANSDANIKVIIVNGAERAFSAGVDLKATSAEGFQKGGRFMELGLEVCDLIHNIPKVTIAQVHGYCFTGALELMLFFDLVFCAESTQFGDTHAKWAVMPRWGMTQNLARRVGLIKAKELTFRAMRVKAPEAERIGLINRAFADDQLETEVNSIAAEIAENSFEAIVAIKDLYNKGFQTTLKEGMEIEYNVETKLSGTDEQLANFEKKKFKN